MIEQTRVRLQNKGISDEDHYMKTLKAASISEDNYFNNLLGNDIVKIAKDIRDAHSCDLFLVSLFLNKFVYFCPSLINGSEIVGSNNPL